MTELPASSPLRHHVVDVVLLRAEEQVLGLGAERAVAAVKHLHPNRDWPNGQCVDKPMHRPQPAVELDFAVAVTESCSRPDQAVAVSDQARLDVGERVTSAAWCHRPFNGYASLPSLVMGMAPTSGIVRPLASVNGAVHSTRVYLS